MEWAVNSNIRRLNRWPIDPTKRNDSPAASKSDILIIGAGVFGTSTAYHLSQQEPHQSITIVDRTPFPPRQAASTDVNKIVRADYSSPFYMDLAYEAMHAWDTWPELRAFYHRTGWMNFVQRGSDVAARIRRNFRDRGHDPTCDIELEEARKMFGGVFEAADLERIESAYWNPEAGWCDAAAAVETLMQIALRKPRVSYVVADIEGLVLGHGGRSIIGAVARSGERFMADKVLLATGAWTSRLMTAMEDELQLDQEDRVEAQIKAAGVCAAHFRMSDREMEALKDMPVVIYGEGGDGQPPPAKSQLLKYVNGRSFTNTITTASGHRITCPPDRDQGTVPERLKQETLDSIAAKVTPKYTTRSVEYWRLCWDAISPSHDHLITRHPSLENLFLAVGGSFHSWKYLPTIGRYITNVLAGRSNGEVKDAHWAWKKQRSGGRGAFEKAYPLRELQDFDSAETPGTRGNKL